MPPSLQPITADFVTWTVGTRSVTASTVFPSSHPEHWARYSFRPRSTRRPSTDVSDTDRILGTLGETPDWINRQPARLAGNSRLPTICGAATYEVPIDTPHGRKGIEPHLRLLYSSRASNGFLGPGWSLAGLSRIERCPRTSAVAIDRGLDSQPVMFESDDELCLDGELLVRAGNGTGNGEYRTQRDTFARILIVGTDDLGPTQFDVYRKDGGIESYGSELTSRLELVQQTPTLDSSSNLVQSRYAQRAGGSGGYQELRTGTEMRCWSPTKQRWP